MVLELNIKDYNMGTGRMLADILQKDRSRFEARLREAVEKAAQDYLLGIAITVTEKMKAEFPGNPEIILKVTLPD